MDTAIMGAMGPGCPDPGFVADASALPTESFDDIVYYGADAGIGTTPVMVESNQVNAQLGRSVSGAGDINGDGYADLVVGAHYYDNGESSEGAAFVFYGSAAGIGTTPTILESNQANAYLGYSVSGTRYRPADDCGPPPSLRPRR